jgi:hypothetical protein
VEIIRAILKIKKNNSLELDEIPNRILYFFINDRPALLVRLFNAYYKLSIYSTAFERVITVLLRKLKKEDYSNPKIYRLIALLNILKKALEAVIAERIRFAAETHALLPNTQIGGRRIRSTETALQLITNKIYII